MKKTCNPPTSCTQAHRLRVAMRGAIQGVGFRPFIYRLACDLELTGWARNSTHGFTIEAEGYLKNLQSFLVRIDKEKPAHSYIQSLESSYLDLVGYTEFEIRASEQSKDASTIVLPDIATCGECIEEIFDSANRRYLYPFTNCTHCGPRFSIVEGLPYDRENTTMKHFPLCDQCRDEYENPHDRRFHAQANACPECGPSLELWDIGGAQAKDVDAYKLAVEEVRQGNILAVKGIGGFHLIVDARNSLAVRELRLRKQRYDKPLALMFPSLEAISQCCKFSALEERLLLSPESPIVLLRRLDVDKHCLAYSIAPGNPYLGVMLPHTPLHHMLMRECKFPVVATSGNLSEETICINEEEALSRLGKIADKFLVNDRPISQHVDDSVVQVVLGREQVLRRAKGYAPLPVKISTKTGSFLAVGGHLKNTVAVSVRDNAFVSQHVGDLDTIESFDTFKKVVASFSILYPNDSRTIVKDAHPNYRSSIFAGDEKSISIQHHYAHVLSCMADNHLKGPVLGIAWDGSGYGEDGTLWGGEFLHVKDTSFERTACWRSFCLPGGEKAMREPARCALGLLYDIYGDDVFAMNHLFSIQVYGRKDLKNLQTMLKKKINCPATTSVGRLFDAVASIIGIRQTSSYEGQAAIELEYVVNDSVKDFYPFKVLTKNGNGLKSDSVKPDNVAYVIDWEPMIKEIVQDTNNPNGVISCKFHNTLVEAAVDIAKRIGETKIIFSGGCFQNRYLTETMVARFSGEGFSPYWHQRIPPNDGGLSLGQIMGASRLHGDI